MVAAGNDFILIDKVFNPEFIPSNKLIQQFCDRRFGIGADGVLIFDKSKIYDFSMDYFNADGTTGALCGNGARCVLKYAAINKKVKTDNILFEFHGEKYSGLILNDGLVTFNLNKPKEIKLDMRMVIDGKDFVVNYVDVGTPHVVIVVNEIKDLFDFDLNIENIPVEILGKKIRYAKQYFINGTNVNFIDINQKYITIRTYERGVESETLACGTGSVSAAIIANLKYNVKLPVDLLTRSGEILTVDFLYENKKVKNMSLTGGVKIVYTGEILI